MRELKFRVWNKATKSWLNDDAGTHCWSEYCLNIFTGEVVEIVTSDNKFFSRANEPNFYFDKNTHVKESPYVVQQFTGLKDRHEKEIYEGDIVKIIYDEAVAEVYFDFNLGAFRLKDNSGKSYPITTYRFDESNKPIGLISVVDEVVGNIMENPELLKA
jgi:uncharacterized phage protein (TIGR01671 family)